MIKKIAPIILCFFPFLFLQSQLADFSLPDLEGEIHNLQTYLDEGNIVVLDFFFVGCGFCADAAPMLEELYETTGRGEEGVIVLSIEMQNNSFNAVHDWEEALGTTFPVIYGAEAWNYWYESVYSFFGGGAPFIAVIYSNPEMNGQKETVYDNLGSLSNEEFIDLKNTVSNYQSILEEANNGGEEQEEEEEEAQNTIDLGLEDQGFIQNSIRLFPNPAQSTIHVEIPADILSKIQTLEIYDLKGQLIKRISELSPQNQIDINELINGKYLLCLLDSEKQTIMAEHFQVIR